MTDETELTLRDTADGSPVCGCCPRCRATHWIAAAIAAQKKLDNIIQLHYQQQLEIAALRRHITDLTTIIETHNLWRDDERRH